MIPKDIVLKAGDIVRIVRPVLNSDGLTAGGLYISPLMLRYVGGVYEVIHSGDDGDRVILDLGRHIGRYWYWDRYCLELVDENNINFDGVEELL